ERQPLAAQARRLVDALDYLGNPLPERDKQVLASAADDADEAKAIASIQEVLDRYCLAAVTVEQPTGPKRAPRLTTTAGPAARELAEQGWRVYLVKVLNPQALAKVELKAESPNALPLFRGSSSRPDPKVVPVGEVSKRFLELDMFGQQPL